MSLYDAQYKTGRKEPIPEDDIKQVVAALRRFMEVCSDFNVPRQKLRVVATEATREAVNSINFRREIETAAGVEVELLPKEEEGRIGALGIASSFYGVKGLIMDLGGGSTQLTWMTSNEGYVQTSRKGSVSLPYGAAALTRLLQEAGTRGKPTAKELQNSITEQFRQALEDLEIPPSIETDGRLSLYLSGGGFRGWGYILMDSHAVQPYPIPLINGFQVSKAAFLPSAIRETSVGSSTFRISSRRASQVPAISFLITALTNALPSLSDIYFAQGGLREGLLFSTLSQEIKSQHPLVAATQLYAPRSATNIFYLLESVVPYHSRTESGLPSEMHEFVRCPNSVQHTGMSYAVTNLLNEHASTPKDMCAAAALRSTTTGILADAHGLAHSDRAVLGLILCERWGGELNSADSVFRDKLQELIGSKASWWAKYLGCMAATIGKTYPAGIVNPSQPRIKISARYDRYGTPDEILVSVSVPEYEHGITEPPEWLETIRKVGKKKNWVRVPGDERSYRSKDGWGLKIRVEIDSMEIQVAAASAAG